MSTKKSAFGIITVRNRALLLDSAKRWAALIIGWLDRRPRLILGIGAAIAIWMALSCTTDLILLEPRFAQRELAVAGDVRNIYFAETKTTWSDIPKWFVGPWNSPGVGYYRPLTSILFFLEYRAFHRDFAAYNRVSWLLNGLNAALLFLFVVSLFSQHRRGRVLLGLIAVRSFTTLESSLFYSVGFSLHWWPAQNDLLSLTFGLLSLLLLDRYLLRPRRVLLAGSLLALACAIGSKEMGYIAMPIALALIWQRKGRPTREMAYFALAAAGFWILRKVVIPNPWGEHYLEPWALRKAIYYWCAPLYVQIRAGIFWVPIASAAITLIVTIGLRRR